MNFIPVSEKLIKLFAKNAVIGLTFKLENLACFTDDVCSMKCCIVNIKTDINYILCKYRMTPSF